MNFEIEGESIHISKTPTVVKKIIEIVSALQDGKLLPTKILADRLHVTTGYLNGFTTNKELQEYRVIIVRPTRQYVYGNKETIKAFKEQLNGG